jgi:DNA-binding XRE family transcriptional regulator
MGMHPIYDDYTHRRMREYKRKMYAQKDRPSTEERRTVRYAETMNHQLHAARVDACLTKRQVAACIHIHPSSYSGYENASRLPGIEIQCMLCLLFGKSAYELGFRRETRA